MLAIKIFELAAILVFVIDISGVIDAIKRGLCRWLHLSAIRSLKPFDCSLCATWWAGLLLLILSHAFTLSGVLLVAVAAYSTTLIREAFNVAYDLIFAIIGIFEKLIKKL